MVSQFGYLVLLMRHTFSLVLPVVGSVLASGNFRAGKLRPPLPLLCDAATLAVVAGMLHLGILAPLFSGHSGMQWPSQYERHLGHCFQWTRCCENAGSCNVTLEQSVFSMVPS
jgi:hypothetical protein